MLIIGCDYHPSFQQIALVDSETGETVERRLLHREEAEQFYGKLREQSVQVREPGLESANHPRERNGALLRVQAVVRSDSA